LADGEPLELQSAWLPAEAVTQSWLPRLSYQYLMVAPPELMSVSWPPV
jgi:hypothetical protein